MSQFDFAGLSETSPLVKSLRAALVKGSGQAVPFVVIGKVKRVTGVSIKDVEMTLENGQTVTYRVKNTGDIFRVQLNGKDLPLKGDMTMLNDVSKEIGEKVRAAQPAFDKRQAAARVVIPKAAASNKVMTTAQRLKAAQEQEAKLDDAIAKATAIRDDLKAKLDGHANGGIPTGSTGSGTGVAMQAVTAPTLTPTASASTSTGGVVRLFDSYRAKKPIPAQDFNAADFAAVHDDPSVSEQSIFDGFPPEARMEMDKVAAKVKEVKPTDQIYTLADGTYTDERTKYHSFVMETAGLGVDDDGKPLPALIPADLGPYMPAPGEPPLFILLGGRGGSGKSRFKGMVYNPPPAVVIDADGIKARMKEYQGWNAAEVHEESSHIVDRALEILLKAGVNVVLDATMKTAKSAIQKVEMFKEKKYRVEAHYMHLPRQEAAKRAVDRFFNAKNGKGRYVPVDVVLGNTTNEQTFEQIKPLVDAWSFRDNNVAKGQDPVLISSSQ